MNENINKTGIKEKIKNFLTEINNKKNYLNSFKKRYIRYKKTDKNNYKSETILISINSLKNLINEFESAISLLLEIILLLQDEHKNNNNKKPINLKENNKITINDYHYLNNKNNENSNEYYNNIKNKRLLLKTHSIEPDKKNYIYQFINNNNTKNNNNKNIFINNSFNNDKKGVKVPYNLFLKNQLNYFSNSNKSNLFDFKGNTYRHNFPSLKERTLQTLYNSEKLITPKNDKSNINNKINNEESEQNNSDKELINNSLGNGTNTIKAKTPIRKALRALLKEKKRNNNSCNQITNIKYNQIDTNENEDNLINKINESKDYKLYFSNKYGEGKYCNFLNKYKNNQINKKEIENELIIISNFYELKEKKDNINNNKKYLNINNSNLINGNESFNKSKTPLGIRKRLLLQKDNINKNNNIINNINNKKKIKKFNRIPKSNRYTNIEELIKSFNDE